MKWERDKSVDPASTGNVTGPATAGLDNIVIFGATGTSIKDSNINITDVALLGGRSTGQTLNGGTGTGDDLTLQSNPTNDGLINLGANSAYDEANDRLGIGKTNPAEALDVVGNVKTSGTITVNDTTEATSGTTGSIHTAGGLGVAKKISCDDKITGGNFVTNRCQIVDPFNGWNIAANQTDILQIFIGTNGNFAFDIFVTGHQSISRTGFIHVVCSGYLQTTTMYNNPNQVIATAGQFATDVSVSLPKYGPSTGLINIEFTNSHGSYTFNTASRITMISGNATSESFVATVID